MRISTILIILLFTQPSLAADTGWEIIDKKETFITEGQFSFPDETHIKFKNGKEFRTNIKEFKLLATIITDENIPFLLFSGRDCTECDANTSIYIHSPLEGYLDGGGGKNSYTYPGKLYYYEDNSLLRKDRLFYGNCLSKTKKNVVWYTNYLGEDNKWHDQVFVVNFLNTKRENKAYEPYHSLLEKTLDYVKQGLCKEIPGIEMSSEP